MLPAMSRFGAMNLPLPSNDPVRGYAPGSAERASIKAELERQSHAQVQVPLWIGGEPVHTGRTTNIVMPHAHAHVLGESQQAGVEEVDRAIASAMEARAGWMGMPFEERIAIFKRMAHLLRTDFRDRMNASTLNSESKVGTPAG